MQIKKNKKSNQVHIILHAGLFFVKYILVRKYILNYNLKKQNTDNERMGDLKSRNKHWKK